MDQLHPPVIKAQNVSTVREFLAGRDIGCPGCNYNLRDATSSRCPECGLELVLTIAPAMRLGTAWITALVISAILSAEALTLVVWMWVNSWLPFEWSLEGIVSASVLITPIVLAALLIFKRAFHRMRPRWQWLIAVLNISVLLLQTGAHWYSIWYHFKQ